MFFIYERDTDFPIVPATYCANKADVKAAQKRGEGWVVKTEADLEPVPTARLVATFNYFATQDPDLGYKPVSRFSDRSAAERRVSSLIVHIDGLEEEKAQREAPKEKKPAAPRRVGKGVNLKPMSKAYACREGSKQAALVDHLSRKEGATFSELKAATAGGRTPWADITVRSSLNWDMNKVKGYGIRTTFINGEEAFKQGRVVEAEQLGWDVEANKPGPDYKPGNQLPVWHLVYPKGQTKPLPHTPLKSKKD